MYLSFFSFPSFFFVWQDGHTALIETAYLGCTEAVQLLLEAGADTSIKDNEVRY